MVTLNKYVLFKYLLLGIILIIVAVLVYSSPDDNSFSRGDLQRRAKQLDALNPPAGGGESYRRILGRYNGYPIEEVYICFGDVCPANGGYFIRYSNVKSESECKEIGGEPIWGFGWSAVYGGCQVKVD